MSTYSVHGYLMLGTSVLTQATEATVEGESGAQFLKTLTGDSGHSDGIPEIDINAQNAVPKTAAEMGRVLAAFANQEDVQFRFRFANYIITSTGRITSFSGGTSVGQANRFGFKFHGPINPGDIQQVA